MSPNRTSDTYSAEFQWTVTNISSARQPGDRIDSPIFHQSWFLRFYPKGRLVPVLENDYFYLYESANESSSVVVDAVVEKKKKKKKKKNGWITGCLPMLQRCTSSKKSSYKPVYRVDEEDYLSLCNVRDDDTSIYASCSVDLVVREGNELSKIPCFYKYENRFERCYIREEENEKSCSRLQSIYSLGVLAYYYARDDSLTFDCQITSYDRRVANAAVVVSAS